MRGKSWIFALVLLALVFSLCAEPPPQAAASAPLSQYGAVTVEAIEGAVGVLKLNGTTVTGRLALNGSLLARSAQLGALEILGEANFTDTLVKGEGKIVGALQARQTIFERPLTLTSKRAVFVASRLKGIAFCKDPIFKGRQVLELKQQTIVDGPISFEGQKGEVYLSADSQLLGPVTGGKVIRK